MIMKSILIKSTIIIFFLMGFLTSCGGDPSLCDCLKSPNSWGCEEVLKERYGVSNPQSQSTLWKYHNLYENDKLNCK